MGATTTDDLLPIIRAAASELTPAELAAPVLVGVSGGPDSLALLHALLRWSREGGPALQAIHVDHQVRPESGAEAAQVRAWCADWGVPLASMPVLLAATGPMAGGHERAAREARYAAFAEVAAACGARILALGHHADDQAETLLLHLLRGAGLAGLAGMPIVRRSGDRLDRLVEWPATGQSARRPAVWRPLLGVRREAIEDYCRAWELAPLRDPSNNDTAIRRNAVRHEILPLIERHFPGATAAITRGAGLLADDEALLDARAADAWARCARAEQDLLVFDRAAFRAEPRAMQRRLLRRAWATLHGSTVGLAAGPIEAARAAVEAGRTGGRWPLPCAITVVVDRALAAVGETATIDERLRRRLGLPLLRPEVVIPVLGPDTIELANGWAMHTERLGGGQERGDSAPHTVHIPFDQLMDTGWVVRGWRDGDHVALPGGGRRKLQDWFVDHHVPRYARRHLALLARGDRVVWVAGLAVFVRGEEAPPQSADVLRLRVLYNGVAVTNVGPDGAGGEGGD